MSNKDTITLPREVVELTLDALMVATTPIPADRHKVIGSITALRTHLAAPEPKPKQEPPRPEAAEVAYEIETHVLFGSGSTISRTLLEKAVTTLRRLNAESEALRRDAERWRFYETAGGDLTGRLHNTRSDHRKAVIDAAMEDV